MGGLHHLVVLMRVLLKLLQLLWGHPLRQRVCSGHRQYEVVLIHAHQVRWGSLKALQTSIVLV